MCSHLIIGWSLGSGSDDKTIKLWDVGLRLAPSVVKSLNKAPIKQVTPVNQAEEAARRDVEEAAKKFKAEQARIAKEKAEQEECERKERENKAAREKEVQAKLAQEKAEREEQARREREARQRAEAERLAQEQKERERKEREIKKAQEKEIIIPKSPLQQLRDSWESPLLDDILKKYESLIQQMPNDGNNYRERGEYYIYKAKKSKVARQQKGYYDKALADFDKAIECNIADDVAAENCPAHWKSLIEQCWQEDKKRPSAETVVSTVMSWPMTEPEIKKPTPTVWTEIDSLNSQDVPTLSSEASFFDTAKETKLNINNIGLKK